MVFKFYLIEFLGFFIKGRIFIINTFSFSLFTLCFSSSILIYRRSYFETLRLSKLFFTEYLRFKLRSKFPPFSTKLLRRISFFSFEIFKSSYSQFFRIPLFRFLNFLPLRTGFYGSPCEYSSMNFTFLTDDFLMIAGSNCLIFELR